MSVVKIKINGEWTAVGTAQAGIQGLPGKNGADAKTPVKGTDYWTDADKAEITEHAKNSVKTKISVDATSGAKSIALSAATSNTEYRYVYASGITSLTLSASESFANNAEAYYSVIFLSGTTATTITNSIDAYFTGDDCTNGAFKPSAGKTYDVGIYWNGLRWQAVVRGV